MLNHFTQQFSTFQKAGRAIKHNFLYASRNTTLRCHPIVPLHFYLFVSSHDTGPVLQVYVIISFFFFCDVPSCIFPPWLLTEDILAFGNGEQASYLFQQPLLSRKLQKKALMQIAKQIPFSSGLWDRYQERRDMGGLASSYQLCSGSISCKEWRRLDWLERSCITKSQFPLNPFVVFPKHISIESITSLLLFAINAFRQCKAIWCLSDYVLSLSFCFLLLKFFCCQFKCAYFLHSFFFLEFSGFPPQNWNIGMKNIRAIFYLHSRVLGDGHPTNGLFSKT